MRRRFFVWKRKRSLPDGESHRGEGQTQRNTDAPDVVVHERCIRWLRGRSELPLIFVALVDLPGTCPAFRSIPSGIGDSANSFFSGGIPTALAARVFNDKSPTDSPLYSGGVENPRSPARFGGSSYCAERPAGLRCRRR